MRVFNFFPSFFSLEFHDNPDVFTPFLALDRENFLKFLTTLTNKRAKLQQDIQHAEELCVNLNSGTQARKDVSAQIAAQKVLERGIRIVYRRILCFLDASSHLYKRVCPSVGPSVRRRSTAVLPSSKNKKTTHFFTIIYSNQ